MSARTSSPMSDPSASRSMTETSLKDSPPASATAEPTSPMPKGTGSSPSDTDPTLPGPSLSLFDPEPSPSEPTRPQPTGATSPTTSPPPSTTEPHQPSSPKAFVDAAQHNHEIQLEDFSPPLTTGSGNMAPKVLGPQTFAKLHGANHAEDHETWAEADTARTLNAMGQAGTNGALVANSIPDVAKTLMSRPEQGACTTDVEATYLPQAAGVRRLTPTETERLQSFPDGWTIVPK